MKRPRLPPCNKKETLTTTLLPRLRRSSILKMARRLLIPWDDWLHSLRPLQDACALFDDPSFAFTKLAFFVKS